MKKIRRFFTVFVCVVFGGTLFAKSIPQGYITPIPNDVLLKDEIKTDFATLRFQDGIPTPQTSRELEDFEKYLRLTQAYFDYKTAVFLQVLRRALLQIDVKVNKTVAMTYSALSSKTVWPLLDPQTVYATILVDTTDGELVLTTPPNTTYGVVLNRWGTAVARLDAGATYVIATAPVSYTPPQNTDMRFIALDTSDAFVFLQTTRDANLTQFRDTLTIKPAYSAPQEDRNETLTEFLDLSLSPTTVLLPRSARFYKLLDDVARHTDLSYRQALRLRRIGITPNRAFRPDLHERALYKKAAQDAALVEAIRFETFSFLKPQNGNDANASRTLTFVLRADANGEPFAGGQTYSLHVRPLKVRWSVTLYDGQTKSMLQNPFALYPYIVSDAPTTVYNDDGSVDIDFGPKPQSTPEENRIQTVAGKNWFAVIRLYGVAMPERFSKEDFRIVSTSPNTEKVEEFEPF